MKWHIPTLDPRNGLKAVLLAQLGLAGLLIVSDVFSHYPRAFDRTIEIPSGPVKPGDQRRQYRTDRPLPDVVRLENPVDLPMPEEFTDQLTFDEYSVEGIGKILLLSGAIEQGDAKKFQSKLASMEDKPDLVALHSPGGKVYEAQQIGRIVRSENLPTGVLPGAFCVSSCPYVLAGGVNRTVSLRGVVGMHQHYYEQPRYLPVVFAVEDIQISQGETMEFLIEMGVNPSLMVFSLNTPPEQIYALVEEELKETMIALEIVE